MLHVVSYFRVYLTITFLFLFFLTIALHKRTPSNRFNKVIIFGDSFSDTGNAYAARNRTWPIDPPFYQGRSCDGPNWVDRLEVLEKYNYAYSGAVTDNNFGDGSTKVHTFRHDLRQEIITYFIDISKKNLDTILPLYIIWIGFNDVLTNPSVNPRRVVNSLMNSIQDLIDVGANNFLIFNQLPLQVFPRFKNLNRSTFYMQITALFNKELRKSLTALKKDQTKPSIYLFDIHALITNIISDTSSRTFTNTVNECWNIQNSKVVKRCSDPKNYVFFDTIHFTSSVHQLITNAIQPFLTFGFQKNTSHSYIYSF
jgi:phospholipase/lecithinase/hemolysin